MALHDLLKSIKIPDDSAAQVVEGGDSKSRYLWKVYFLQLR